MLWIELKMKELLSNWNLENSTIEILHPTVLKVTSHNNTYYLKNRKHSSFTERMEEFRITRYLVNNGFPAETPLLTKHEEAFIAMGEGYHSLYASFEGASPMSSKVMDSAQFFSLGENLAWYHFILNACPIKENTVIWDVYGNLKSWLSVNIHGLNDWAGRVYEVIAPCEALFGGLPLQLVHSDVHLRNVLWDEEGIISGLIDFEKVRQSPRVADIAYLITSILRDSAMDGQFVFPSRKINRLLNGYTSRQHLSDAEVICLPPLIIVFLLQYTLYYSRQGLEQEAACYVRRINDLVGKTEFEEIVTDI
ncbi:phosphotransferase [Rossellomorea oryzaecorticis]|uniref:Phosphotransferase n=1 Tax=Rossellomorea oryzaecorticis TaxID=1396505 RepID=A0ABU9KA73_9BACI